MLVFSEPDCGPCAALMPEVGSTGPHPRTREEVRHTGDPHQRTASRGRSRAVPSDWDLILGLDSSAIGTLVERKPVHAAAAPAPHDGQGDGHRIKNGPPFAGHGAEAVGFAIADAISTLRDRLRRSLTWTRRRDGSARPARCRHRSTSTSATRTHHGSAGGMRTPTECCASTSPRAPTCPDTPAGISMPSLSRSIGRSRKTLAWKTPAEPSTSFYDRRDGAVLRRPLEPEQYPSWAFGRRLRATGVLGSMGSIGAAYDNAMTESFSPPCRASCSTSIAGRRVASWPCRLRVDRGLVQPSPPHSSIGDLSESTTKRPSLPPLRAYDQHSQAVRQTGGRFA